MTWDQKGVPQRRGRIGKLHPVWSPATSPSSARRAPLQKFRGVPGQSRYKDARNKTTSMHAYHTIGLIHALPPTSRRGFDRKEAASYVGISPTHFDKLVRIGTMPQPVEFLGRKIWDRHALDRTLDALSGFGVGGSSGENWRNANSESPLEAWRRRHGES